MVGIESAFLSLETSIFFAVHLLSIPVHIPKDSGFQRDGPSLAFAEVEVEVHANFSVPRVFVGYVSTILVGVQPSGSKHGFHIHIARHAFVSAEEVGEVNGSKTAYELVVEPVVALNTESRLPYIGRSFTPAGGVDCPFTFHTHTEDRGYLLAEFGTENAARILKESIVLERRHGTTFKGYRYVVGCFCSLQCELCICSRERKSNNS